MDDQLEVCPPVTAGWDYNPDKDIMEYSWNKAMEDTDEPSVWTARILQKIRNKIDNWLQLTFDTPEMNDNHKLPVLDLEIWVADN